MSVLPKRLALLLTMVVFIAVSATDIFLPSLPQIATETGATTDHVNWMLSLFICGSAAGSLFCGLLSDRFGRRWLYLRATGLFCLVTVLIPAMPTLNMMIALRFVQGLVCSVFIVVSRQIIHDACDQRAQVRYTGMLSLGVMLSPAIAPVIGAYIAHNLSWHACFWLSAGLAAAMLLVLIRTLPETLPQAIMLPGLRELGQQYLQLLGCARYRLNVLSIGFSFAAYFTFICTSSYLYIGQFGLDQRSYGKIFIILALAYLAGNMGMQWLNQHLQPREHIIGYAMRINLLGAMLGLLTLLVSESFGHVLILTLAAILLRAGYAMMVSPIQVLAMNALPANQGGRPGLAMGMLMFILYLLSAVCSSLVSVFTHHLLQATVVGMLLFSLVAFGLHCRAMVVTQALRT